MATKKTKAVSTPASGGWASLTQNAGTAPVPEKKDSAVKERDEIVTPGLRKVAAIDTVMDALAGLLGAPKQVCKDMAALHFEDRLVITGKKPESIDGREGSSHCTYVMGSSSSIKDEIETAMDQHNVAYDTIEGLPERWVINPNIVDQDILDKVANALIALNLGVEIVQRQPATGSQIKITPETFRTLAQVKNPDIRSRIFKAVSQVSLKTPVFDDTPDALQHAVDFLRDEGMLKVEAKVDAKVEDKAEKKAKAKK